MHKSIFLQINEFKTDPITEFNKIKTFIENTYCASYIRIINVLNSTFPNSKILSSNYINFEECVKSIAYSLNNYKNENFNKLDDNLQEIILEEYLNYCEILLSLHRLFVDKLGGYSTLGFKKNII